MTALMLPPIDKDIQNCGFNCGLSCGILMKNRKGAKKTAEKNANDQATTYSSFFFRFCLPKTSFTASKKAVRIPKINQVNLNMRS